MSEVSNISVSYGDGVGAEIMTSALSILRKSGVMLNIDIIQTGYELYTKNYPEGITPDGWRSLKRSKVLLKSPVNIPEGNEFKDIDSVLKKNLSIYAEASYFISLPENKSEYNNAYDKILISQVQTNTNSEYIYDDICHLVHGNDLSDIKRLIYYSFEFAKSMNRKKVTCFSDSSGDIIEKNFISLFNDISKEYSDIESDCYYSNNIEEVTNFDVIVTPIKYKKILEEKLSEYKNLEKLSKINVGREYIYFSPAHEVFLEKENRDIVNPAAMIHAASMMLAHLDNADIASKIHNAWLKMLEEGIHTEDYYNDKYSKRKVSTSKFTEDMMFRIGKKPENIDAVNFSIISIDKINEKMLNANIEKEKILVGVDIFINWQEDNIDDLFSKLNIVTENNMLKVQFIASGAFSLYPEMQIDKVSQSILKIRFIPEGEKITTQSEIIKLLTLLNTEKLDFVSSNNLYLYKDSLGFSL